MIFLLARRLIRHFDAVFGIDGIDVLDGRHDLSVGGVITTEFVRKEPMWFFTLAFQQAAKEAFRSLFVASALHQNINGVAILIDGTPKVVALWFCRK